MTKIDKRKLLIMIYALGSFVNLGYALFHSLQVFVVFRVLHGIQYGFAGSLVMTLAAESLPDEKMAAGMGVFGISGSNWIGVRAQFIGDEPVSIRLEYFSQR